MNGSAQPDLECTCRAFSGLKQKTNCLYCAIGNPFHWKRGLFSPQGKVGSGSSALLNLPVVTVALKYFSIAQLE